MIILEKGKVSFFLASRSIIRGNKGITTFTILVIVEKTSAFNTFNPFTQIVSATFQNDAGILGAAALSGMV